MSDTSHTDKTAPAQEAPAKQKRGLWLWHPEFPLRESPLAHWPIKPFVLLKDLLGGWLPISEKLIIAGISVSAWFYFAPALERCQDFAFGWIAQIYFRNLLLLVVIAGGLHLYLYTFRKQGDRFRYDGRPFQRGARFTFSDQTYDNMFWSLASGVTIWSAFEVVGMWAYANAYLPYFSFAEHPVWFVAMFVVIPLWGNFHFYWIHRLIHWGPLYKTFHALHHRNIVTGPWSGMSMHPVEHLLYFSSIIIHLVLATHPIHFICHLMTKALQGPTSHSGYEKLLVRQDSDTGLHMGDFFHQLHHRYFECNYGEPGIPFDQWFGTYHDGTEEGLAHIRTRMREKGIKRS